LFFCLIFRVYALSKKTLKMKNISNRPLPFKVHYFNHFYTFKIVSKFFRSVAVSNIEKIREYLSVTMVFLELQYLLHFMQRYTVLLLHTVKCQFFKIYLIFFLPLLRCKCKSIHYLCQKLI
jgi:hypothetical protein